MAPVSISTKHSFRSARKPVHSQPNSGPSMKQLALLFLAVILAAQPFKKVQAAVELPAGSRLAVQTLRSAGNRRLLDDTVVSDYTAWCTPSRDELHVAPST
jgi:hypothetical protein